MLQTAASAWHDDDVAAAVGELLYRAMELAGDLQVRSLFDLLGLATNSVDSITRLTCCVGDRTRCSRGWPR